MMSEFSLREKDLLIWAMIGGAILWYVLYQQYQLYRRKKWLRRAKKAEKQAIAFLEKQGYRILDIQSSRSLTTFFNGVAHNSKIRADLIVRRGWKTYIVEIKSGRQGDGTLPNVRRQLLEYDLVFRPQGMLLLDMEHETLEEITFGYAAPTSIREKVLAIMLLCTLAMVVFLWIKLH